MEENVALDSGKQKKFVKSIRGIKKLIKKNEKVAKSEPKKKEDAPKPAKPFSMRLKDGKIRKKRKERGLVYLSHIPHGFYEHQMTQYFKQFGVVTNARVIRSKRTGNSKGFAFVEFKEPSVAQIVAETMNNYLMGKRLIKAVYIEPEKQKRRAFRKHWNAVHNPTSIRRLKLKKAFNADKDEAFELQKAKKMLTRITKTKKKLSELGINYDFFTPVDIPKALLDKVVKQEKDESNGDTNDKEKKSKKNKIIKKEEKIESKAKVEIKEQGEKKMAKNIDKKVERTDSKVQKPNNAPKQELKKEVVKKDQTQDVKVNKKDQKVNKKEQQEKEEKLTKAGVKSVEEFISLNDDESDESYEFDSDEYEKMIGDDDDFSSSDAEETDENEDDENSDGGKEAPPVIAKGNNQVKNKVPPQVAKKVQINQKQQKQKPVNKEQSKLSSDGKRKAPQKQPVAAKKPKFEKKKQIPMKKQIKKK